jgi:HK97 family phage portal protein
VARTSLLAAALNRTSPSAPDLPTSYVGRGTSGLGALFGRRTDAEAQMRAMGSVGTLFAIVHRTSNATAQVEWKLWRKAKSGRSEDRTEVTSHAALDLWRRPNRFYTRQEFVEAGQQHLDLTGETWWVVSRAKGFGAPLEMWPVRPDRMTPIPSATRFLDGYVYTSPDGEQVPLALEDVIFLRMPNPLDPYRGMGPVQAVLADLDASRYSAEWNRNFFLSSAEPGGIIQVPRNLDDDQFAQLRMRWNEQHRGVANAHRVAILEGEGTQWIDRKLSQRDMQFAELRTVTSGVIREAFGISQFALGVLDDVNRASADAAGAWFAEYLTVPRLERIKQALNNDLLPLFGDTARDLEFDYENPVPPDLTAEAEQLLSRANAANFLLTTGLDPAQVLPACGFPEMQYAPRPALAAVQPPAARTPLAFAPPATTIVRQLPRATAADGGEPDRELADVRAAYEAALEQLLAAWDARVLPGQYAAIAGQVQEAVDSGQPDDLSALTVGTDTALAVLRPALADAADAAARQMAAEAARQGVTVDAPTVDEALRDSLGLVLAFGGELVAVAAAVVNLLAGDLTAAAGREALRLYTPGADGSSVATRVTNFLRGLVGARRRDLLGSALHRAINLGRLATLRQAPTATYEACEVMDSNTCAPCSAIDGTVFADLAAAEAAYGAGAYRECEGGDRCRGTVVAIWEAP